MVSPLQGMHVLLPSMCILARDPKLFQRSFQQHIYVGLCPNPKSLQKAGVECLADSFSMWPWGFSKSKSVGPQVDIRFDPSTKIGSKMGDEFTYPKMGSHWF